MGIKSTVTITRKNAEAKAQGLLFQTLGALPTMSNSRLETVLEDLNDNLQDNFEGYENYLIKD